MNRIGPMKIKYEAGHSYDETWEQTDFYCPGCGSKQVWVEVDAWDYYQGPNYLCLGCEAMFTLPSGCSQRGDWQTRQRLQELKPQKAPPQWTHSSERLPEEGQNIIVWTGAGARDHGWAACATFFRGAPISKFLEYWMPAPDSPYQKRNGQE